MIPSLIKNKVYDQIFLVNDKDDVWTMNAREGGDNIVSEKLHQFACSGRRANFAVMVASSWLNEKNITYKSITIVSH